MASPIELKKLNILKLGLGARRSMELIVFRAQEKGPPPLQLDTVLVPDVRETVITRRWLISLLETFQEIKLKWHQIYHFY